MRKPSSLKISISGVRGVIGDSLTPQLAGTLAQAFGTYVGGGPVVVGRDTRTSGPMLEQAVLAGLLATGCQPVKVGICPIPSFLFLTRDIKAAGGIDVTASHNPKAWNGLKFISRAGLYLTPHQTEEFLEIYHQGEFTLAPPERFKPAKTEPAPAEPHLRRLLDYFDGSLIRRKKFKVALDCASGAGATLAPRLLEELGCETILINAVPDGSFAHQPEPLPENIREICRMVVRRKADIGFVQDADADRLAVVSEKGLPLGEEMTLALAAQYVLSRKKGSVVCNLSTSRAIDDIAGRRKSKVIRTKIGEINVVEGLLAAEPPAAVGGEGNGGVILLDIHPCRDSFTAMALILEAMARSEKSISGLRRELPNYVMIKDKLDGSAEQAFRLIGRLRKLYEGRGRVSLLDGMKVDFPDHWIHIRPSNTEPVIRVIAEAKTAQAARAALQKLKKEIAGLQRQFA
jgi:phosphomannomutase